ncbi:hypothetical protein GKR41_00223 [Candidatus Vallotia lariciata]|nr:hypothetical protein GKR41_00223 [Candidatus Vallotia lariciata]
MFQAQSRLRVVFRKNGSGVPMPAAASARRPENWASGRRRYGLSGCHSSAGCTAIVKINNNDGNNGYDSKLW